MIPKLIHYFWFGRKPIPDQYKEYIDTWKHFLPDYKIIQWNEDNFDVNECRYCKEAYLKGKWAFVSDYARFKVLYEYGGLYFDTDVEVIKPMEDIIERGAFVACETEKTIAPGLALGVEPHNEIYKEIIDAYEKRSFIRKNGDMDLTTVVEFTTDIFKSHGFAGKNEIESFDGLISYPPNYFCPVNYQTGEMVITNETYTIHHYGASWHTTKERDWLKKEQALIQKIGLCRFQKKKKKVWYKIRMNLFCYGLFGTLRKIISKIKCK